MSLLKPYLKKEILEWTRTQRLMILGIAILFFTFSTPLMLYALPIILKNQMPELLTLFKTSQSISLTNFIGDVYQIFGGIVLFFGFKSFTKEFSNGQFITPWITGANIKKVYLAKFLSFIMMVFMLITISTTFSYFYAGLIFNDFTTPIASVFSEILAVSSFIFLHLSVLLLLSSKKISNFIVIPVVFGSYYILPGLFSLLSLNFDTPFDLLNFDFNTLNYDTSVITLAITVIIVTLSILTLKTLNIGASHGRKTASLSSTTR